MAGRALRRAPRLGAGSDRAGRLAEMRLGVEELLLDARLQAGEVQEVAALARARVAEAPLRERRWVVLSVAQYRQGRQADALATVRRARGLLAAELGLDPCAELAELEQAILRQDPSLLSDRVFRAASPECPYFGLPPAGWLMPSGTSVASRSCPALFGRSRSTACSSWPAHRASASPHSLGQGSVRTSSRMAARSPS